MEKELETKEPRSIDRVASQIHRLGEIVGPAGLTSFQTRSEGVFRDRSTMNHEVMLYASKGFRTDLLKELESYRYFVISPAERELYDGDPVSPNASRKFTKAKEEIQDSGKCLALNLHTACVFHSMRALEIGLRALATRLEIPFRRGDRATWGDIIKEIETELPIYRRAHPSDAHLDFYDEAANHFRYVKNAWRNHTMHARTIYTRDKAEEILKHTIRIIEDLTEGSLEESQSVD